MKGTLAISWGKWTRPYIYSEGYCWRVVGGPAAITYIPNVEIEGLMSGYISNEEMTSSSVLHLEEVIDEIAEKLEDWAVTIDKGYDGPSAGKLRRYARRLKGM